MQKRALLLSLLFVLCHSVLAAEERLAPIEPPMVSIPGGQFKMGSDHAEESQPIHQVTIKPFRLGKFEVTIAEFTRFVEATGYSAPHMCIQMAGKQWFDNIPTENMPATTILTRSQFEPATCIGWNGANAYVQWLAKETGKKYRLASEAEWEYANRAGAATRYFFGMEETQVCKYGNVGDLSQRAAIKRDYDGLDTANHVGQMPCDDKAEYASIVGMYQPNAFGVYDTIGNVSEFVADCNHDNYIGAPTDGRAWVDGDCKERVVRGENWHWRAAIFSARNAMPADMIGSLEGFRIAEDIDGNSAEQQKIPSAFEVELGQAQSRERERRSKLAELTPTE